MPLFFSTFFGDAYVCTRRWHSDIFYGPGVIWSAQELKLCDLRISGVFLLNILGEFTFFSVALTLHYR